MEHQQRSHLARRVTLFGALINVLLGFSKIGFGIMGHSQSLIADGVHSLADLFTDVLVLFASHFGSRAADQDHPYGHGRIETAATMFLALLIILTGVGIALDSVLFLRRSTFEVPHPYVLLVALLSVVANEGLFHYTKRVAKQIHSELLYANAWHHRSDAASSIIVLIGVAGALLGYYYLDAVAAVLVGLMIIKMGWNLGWSSIRELVDTAVEPELLAQINNTIEQVSGVVAIHQLRTRSMGANVLVDVHVMVQPKLSVSEGHHISERVYRALARDFPTIKDVTVHIDPEDDEFAAPCLELPPREKIIPQLQKRWQAIPAAKAIDKIHLHYLSGKIYVECILHYTPELHKRPPQELAAEFERALLGIEDIAEVKVLYQ